ncbi:MAG: MarR family transcriptional regulator [Erysipelotrichaceae bacterium]|jgi:DNA-binding MarR family transcriptional regulator|nr:MarR family transcriptional regulator [Bacilli bacterium]NLV29176.1 MarR family transcriptional regulator [Erysipelotrichaceae bacterium]HPY79841.1 MarR family transcriptional regulator [Bacilli bacterium]HQA55824.1 MarR family transcriptional regulator [Bacilli bacterium]
MKSNREQLNHFLVVTFNTILRLEEKTLENLTNNRLSISEVHLLETVFETYNKRENTATNIARAVGITLGSLTTAVKTLEKKGYLVRERDTRDKRIIHITPTPIATFVNEQHRQFHEKMVEEIVASLSLQEEEVLIHALGKVEKYFNNQISK